MTCTLQAALNGPYSKGWRLHDAIRRGWDIRIGLQDTRDEFHPRGPSLRQIQSFGKEQAMRKLVVTEFVSLDGVMEGPGGENPDLGPWTFAFDRGDEGNRFKLDETMAADALLLGRVTYEGFAAAWPDREDEVGFADKFNSMPKYVVSSTLTDPAWNNSRVIAPDDLVDAVNRLKQEGDGDLMVAGSATLVGALMEHDLVDEYRLMVHPVVLGGGKKLFPEGRPRTTLRLSDCRPVGPDGVAILIYEPVR